MFSCDSARRVPPTLTSLPCRRPAPMSPGSIQSLLCAIRMKTSGVRIASTKKPVTLLTGHHPQSLPSLGPAGHLPRTPFASRVPRSAAPATPALRGSLYTVSTSCLPFRPLLLLSTSGEPQRQQLVLIFSSETTFSNLPLRTRGRCLVRDSVGAPVKSA